jgi:RIO-like serine/threonine protein kinase
VIRDAIVGEEVFLCIIFPKLSLGSVAHTAAYNKTGILPRDISAGNILITDEGTGILINWDLSKKVKEASDSKPRRHSRTVRVHLSRTNMRTELKVREHGNLYQ